MSNRILFPVSIALLLFATLLSVSCGSHSQSTAADFRDTVYSPEYASGFVILGAEGRESSLIEVSNPWQGAENVKSRLFIARGGESAPEGFDGQVLVGDARRIVAMSSTHVAMLDAIGQSDRIVGVSGLDFISNENIQRRRDQVGDVGYETASVNYELLASLQPDIVLLYGVSGASQMEGKLRELGIPYVYLGDYLEESPLGKAEWLVMVAELTGSRIHGVETFRRIPERYNAVKQLVERADLPRPKVMVNAPYGDTWFMPSRTNYSVRLIEDAGGRYIYDKVTGNASRPIDLEEAYLLTSDADLWINLGQARSVSDLRAMCPKFVDTKVFTSRQLYNNNRRLTPAGGNDFYESGIVRPDAVIADLARIFHPQLADSLPAPTYYKQLQ